MIVLIPAYEPDERLLDLVDALHGFRVVVVDDGSGSRYARLFADVEARGAEVVRHLRNAGKGRALKTGLAHIAARYPGTSVVTADSDGQHRPDDIDRVARATKQGDALVLGGRRFTGRVPLRSRAGNAVSRRLFSSVSGVRVHDTQTGLRGIPAAMIPWLLTVPGERFEWELTVLLRAAAAGHGLREIEITTVYIDGNASSHFRPVHDSIAVMRPMLRYVVVSLGSFALDWVALTVLFSLSESLLLSVVLARVLSASANFALNRTIVFEARRSGSLPAQLGKYVALAVALLALNYAGLAALTGLGVALTVAKPLTDTVLYLGAFVAQRYLVFARDGRLTAPTARARSTRSRDIRASSQDSMGPAARRPRPEPGRCRQRGAHSLTGMR
ncbi:glycosyltransferase [Herbiconiux sp. SYSU D00978]|uniref:glycosyltransferase n=1 Tax=Herbiconiux sp. SYSU D00978 TaxID=2812562 RepID=UPI001A962C20|nr:glycosyltransferase [Herbiconiux sp. SYSU D00978]